MGFSEKKVKRFEISLVSSMDEINLVSTDLNLFIYETRNRIVHSSLGRNNEVTQTKNFELLRKNKFHQFEVLLIRLPAMTDGTDT